MVIWLQTWTINNNNYDDNNNNNNNNNIENTENYHHNYATTETQTHHMYQNDEPVVRYHIELCIFFLKIIKIEQLFQYNFLALISGAH